MMIYFQYFPYIEHSQKISGYKTSIHLHLQLRTKIALNTRIAYENVIFPFILVFHSPYI